LLGTFCHPIIVRDKSSEIATQLLCGGEMNRIKRAQVGWQESASIEENPVTQANEVKASKYVVSTSDSNWSRGKKSPQYFRPSESTG
jgi:hypothetical protein